MKKRSVKDLPKKYPKIFSEMKYISVGDGWYWLLDALCSHITFLCDNRDSVKQVVAIQVKEKFGTLRFYVGGASDEAYHAIHFAESLSSYVCEDCGSTDQTVKTRGGCWIRTLCDTCKKTYKKEGD